MAKDDFKTWRKKKRLLLGYHWRSIRRRTAFMPLFLFLVAFILFAIISYPNMKEKIKGTGKPLQPVLIVYGKVSEEVISQKGDISTRPLNGAVIEVGGARTSSNVDGMYELQFTSPDKKEIPLIFRSGERQEVSRFSFDDGTERTRKDYVFHK